MRFEDVKMAAKKQTTKPEPVQEQAGTTMRISPELKATLDEMKGEQESYADVVRRLMITKTVMESDKGMVTLKMPESTYLRLLTVQSSTIWSDMLAKAKVSG
jgi:hypothetical protein